MALFFVVIIPPAVVVSIVSVKSKAKSVVVAVEVRSVVQLYSTMV